jgi:hypothetical protein
MSWSWDWAASVGCVATAANVACFLYNAWQAARCRRLNAMLLRICVDAYLMRAQLTGPMLGFDVRVRPLTLAEWQAEMWEDR